MHPDNAAFYFRSWRKLRATPQKLGCPFPSRCHFLHFLVTEMVATIAKTLSADLYSLPAASELLCHLYLDYCFNLRLDGVLSMTLLVSGMWHGRSR